MVRAPSTSTFLAQRATPSAVEAPSRSVTTKASVVESFCSGTATVWAKNAGGRVERNPPCPFHPAWPDTRERYGEPCHSTGTSSAG